VDRGDVGERTFDFDQAILLYNVCQLLSFRLSLDCHLLQIVDLFVKFCEAERVDRSVGNSSNEGSVGIFERLCREWISVSSCRASHTFERETYCIFLLSSDCSGSRKHESKYSVISLLLLDQTLESVDVEWNSETIDRKDDGCATSIDDDLFNSRCSSAFLRSRRSVPKDAAYLLRRDSVGKLTVLDVRFEPPPLFLPVSSRSSTFT